MEIPQCIKKLICFVIGHDHKTIRNYQIGYEVSICQRCGEQTDRRRMGGHKTINFKEADKIIDKLLKTC